MKRLIVSAAVVVVVVMMHGWQAFAGGISPVLSCTPDCTGEADGTKVPNPFNCTEFYYCISGDPAPHPTPCDAGNEFDATSGECGPAGTEPCEAICGTGSGCQLTCNGTTGAVVADAFDCSHYYYCNPGGTTDGYCTADRPYFDGANCVADESVCCTGYCDPYCDGTGFAMVPDPNNCTTYYVCEDEEGMPGEGVHFPCGAGEYFNIQMGYCMSGAPDPCPTLCQALVGGSTTTTSTTTTTASGGGGTTTTTSPGGCVSSMTCTAEGFFPACQTCQPEYFSCSAAGAAGVLLACNDGDVFNTNPEYPICLMAGNCPYP